MSHSFIKLAHLLSLVLWLGPAIGAYWILFRIGKNPAREIAAGLEKFYEEVLILEHVAFVFLITSGFFLWRDLGIRLTDAPWLRRKLFFVTAIVIIEIIDIAFSHFYYRCLKKYGATPDSPPWKKFIKWRRIFYVVVVPPLFVMVFAVMALAVYKK